MSKRKVSLFSVFVLVALSLLMIASRGFWDTGDAARGSDALEVPATDSSATADTSATLFTVNARLKRGDNLASLLLRNRVSEDEVSALLPIINHLTDLRRLQVRSRIGLEFDSLGLKQMILTRPNAPDHIRLNRTGPLLFVASVDTLPTDTVLVRFEGAVQDNFYDSFLKAGGTSELAIKYYQVFEFVHYFAWDTRRGDRYRMIAEEIWRNGHRIGYGNVIAAQYISGKDTLTAVWMPKDDSEFGGEHFDSRGYSLRRVLLRLPFSAAARLTSKFGRRKHPITGHWRMHQGVDLAERMGTPVYATGSGRITIMKRMSPGYGNWIHIVHGKTGYQTRYGHMRGFARGLHKGSWVRQGQLIGYVGATGHATGPHLHYEVFVHGRRVDPRTVTSDPVDRLKGGELKEFLADYYRPWRALLENPGDLPGDRYQGPLPETVIAAHRQRANKNVNG